MKDLFSLQDKAVIITGGAGGIGSGTAILMAERGADIAVVDVVEPAAAQGLLDQIKARGRKAIYVRCNVGVGPDAERMVDEVGRAFGKIDVLCNNASFCRMNHLVNLTEEQWDETIAVNLRGTYLCSRAAGRHMLPRRAGCIVNTVSIAGLIGLPRGLAHYGAAKAGMIGFTRTLAVEWAPLGLRVNAVAPGQIATAPLKKLMENPEYARQILGRIPMGRAGEVPEIAAAIMFLASDAASFITGHTLVVDGGCTAS
jgi:3-oxoacyl-[acyl-carrier protein] reductase